MTGQPFVLNGDYTAAVIDIISHDSRITSFGIDHITSDMKLYRAGMTYVCVTLLGGSYKFLYLKRPRIDIEVFAATRSRAYDISAMIQAVIFSKQNDYRANGVNLCAVQVETDIFLSDEKDTDQLRYIQSLRLVCKPWP